MDASERGPGTAGEDYAERLNKLQGKWWKKLLPVQAPYHWNMRRRLGGRTLDVGCGNGRNLAALGPGSVGVDHNPHLVQDCRALGLRAYTTEEFFADPVLSAPRNYDSLLAAHLIEHLEVEQAREVLGSYLPLVRPGGRILFVTPQERGYASDPTHLVFTDFTALAAISDDLGLRTVKQYSFPFPRRLGKAFIYNEFNHVAEQPRV
ncbi:methyltransferase domain-containing protein [Nakamurella sp. YIM 132087]|uniref:Methyltransferase domain-containing protein n=1 Tax=Nakamurella alba TaxID=2665158 RepID=A0A7K1FMV2_9ACTN|nr:class I SAM-dependent methyltransferase [Nakamurella alba]MTD14104.1 methyltransferase domain-containing protein [Nakamurella alba]